VAQPIIFLDVDGVLNHRAVFLPSIGPDPLCPKAVDRFLRLIVETGAQVVLRGACPVLIPNTCESCVMPV
jgi:hypothetical protein